MQLVISHKNMPPHNTEPFIYSPPCAPLEWLHIDPNFVIINKPAGLLSQPGRDPNHYDSAWSRVRQQYPTAELVHRLDMDTSGILLFSLNKNSERSLKIQFQQRQTKKRYLAEVSGVLAAKQGEVDLPLICDWPKRPLQKVCFQDGKPSQTLYRVLEQDDTRARVALYPVTGRSHQLRVHMLALGHPIIGDRFYAPTDIQLASPRLLLHAEFLQFFHPKQHYEISCTAPCEF